ncbi:electron transporter RnfA [Megasphaera cerevisiae DSM 20462]|uniref:Ion-translocating oxidoreductase complex subunit A n=2 Tax=Megasphaera TaxID=906 RepID=A0A0J6WXL1_9FIRM|nr:electron transporter RnfA [Megasphaera cerevisiae DSM 20462]OKY54077.1 electron transport complex subunit RsxA [Megasphaera cerevisiae]
MMEYFTLFVGAVLINNFVLTKFLGLCIFFGVSKNLNASIGMGFAVTSVITMSTVLAWLLYNFVLVPFGLTFLRTISFVVLIASFVQLLEIIIKKQSPTLYNMWGIYLMLIATNCIVLSVPVISVTNEYGFLENLVFAVGSGLGFALALILMASCREKLDFADVPHALKGTPIAFIVAGMLSLAFLGFSGMI